MRAVSRGALHGTHQDTGLVELLQLSGRGDRERRRRPRHHLGEQRAQAVRQCGPREAQQHVAARGRAAAPALLGSSIACASAPASAASSSGSTSHPVWPGRTMSAGPKRSTATAGRPQAMPSTRAEPNCSRTEARTTTSAAAKYVGQLVVLVPAGEVHVARAGHRGSRRTGARPPTPPGSRRGGPARRAAALAQRLAGADEGAHEQAQALDLGEAARPTAGRARSATAAACSGRVGDRALIVAGPPALRVRRPGAGARRRPGRRCAARSVRGRSRWARRRTAPASMPSTRSARASWLWREQQQALAAQRPAAHPLAPTPRRAPSPRAGLRRCARA